MDLISIIIPVYKVEKYINQCLNSVINQTYQNLEIILVDDGSPDTCGQICDEYAQKDSRIKVIHKENGGLSSARNAGLDIAKGEYISFVDSDDYVSFDFIETLYQRITEDQSDISMCEFTRNEEELGTKSMILKNKVCHSEEAILKLNNNDINLYYVVMWNKLYKRNLFDKIRFPIGKICEDTFVTYILFDISSKISTINKRLYFYRYNKMGITKSEFSIKRLDALEGYESECNYFFDKNKKLYLSACLMYGLFLKDMYIYLNKSNIENKKTYMKEILKKGRKNIFNMLKSCGTFRNKIKAIVFFSFPNLYCDVLVKLMDNVKEQ